MWITPFYCQTLMSSLLFINYFLFSQKRGVVCITFVNKLTDKIEK